MKASKLMRKKSESAKGFTLIELMIVVAIIGILASVAIPNFLKARDKAKWTICVESGAALKVAQEMYISDEGTYADDFDLLAPYMIPGCTAQDGSDCPGEVYTRLTGGPNGPGACYDCGLVSMANGFDYEILCTARDRYQCEICMKPKGYLPAKYSDCNAAWAMTCL